MEARHLFDMAEHHWQMVVGRCLADARRNWSTTGRPARPGQTMSGTARNGWTSTCWWPLTPPGSYRPGAPISCARTRTTLSWNCDRPGEREAAQPFGERLAAKVAPVTGRLQLQHRRHQTGRFSNNPNLQKYQRKAAWFAPVSPPRPGMCSWSVTTRDGAARRRGKR